MKVKVELNKAAIKTLERARKQALEMTGAAVKTNIETSAVVPKETGELERSGFVDTSEMDRGKVSIKYDTPYARRLYWHPEFNFRTDKNENAQGLWMQSYIDGVNKDFIRVTYAKFLKSLSKGLIK